MGEEILTTIAFHWLLRLYLHSSHPVGILRKSGQKGLLKSAWASFCACVSYDHTAVWILLLRQVASASLDGQLATPMLCSGGKALPVPQSLRHFYKEKRWCLPFFMLFRERGLIPHWSCLGSVMLESLTVLLFQFHLLSLGSAYNIKIIGPG